MDYRFFYHRKIQSNQHIQTTNKKHSLSQNDLGSVGNISVFNRELHGPLFVRCADNDFNNVPCLLFRMGELGFINEGGIKIFPYNFKM